MSLIGYPIEAKPDFLIQIHDQKFLLSAVNADNVITSPQQHESLASCASACSAMYAGNDKNQTPTVVLTQTGSSTVEFELTLGEAIRLFPRHLVVCVASVRPPDTVFFSLGFRILRTETKQRTDQFQRWFEFRLSDYKQSPDWLNARYWANPERFGTDDNLDPYSDEEEE